MIIPKYWAEARLQHRERKRQVTVRRFGWSDVGEAEAQAHADKRVREAFDRAMAGETLLRRERLVAYNGADGVPIREETVDRSGDTVITRNGYGALCLNTPNVLFADIDFERKRGCALTVWSMVATAVAIFAVLWSIPQTVPMALIFAPVVGGLILGPGLAYVLDRSWMLLWGGHERYARRKIAGFLRKHPDWRVRVYRTPAGLRLLALHRLFDPREPEVAACFTALGVDPMYAQMCFKQNCFRARISPKPWRIGLQRLRAPHTAAWRPEHADLPARRLWIEAYEREAQGYASCRFTESMGSGRTDLNAEAVQQLHDAFCRVDQDLKIA
jgi:hypothetical protein